LASRLNSSSLMMVAVAALLFSSSTIAIDSYSKVPLQRPNGLKPQSVYQTKSYTFSVLAYSTEQPTPLNAIHSWRISIKDSKGSAVTDADTVIDITMPEHLHGMTTIPVISRLEQPGEYLVEGIKFHMPGWWRLNLDISSGAKRDLIRLDVLVGES